MITLNSIASRNEERIAHRELDSDNAIIVHFDSMEEFRISGTGLFVWRLIKEATSVSEIIKLVSGKYRVSSEEAQPHIISYLSEMYRKGSVKIDGLFLAQNRNEDAKRLINTDTVIRKVVIENNIPYTTNFALSYRCNLHCSHCYIPNMRNVLDTLEIKKALDQLAQLKGIYVRFTGGEPFLRKDILEILRYAKSKSFAVAVNTNGFFLVRAIVEELCCIYPMDINISLYGYKQETHDFVTQRKGSFEISMRAIEMLKDCGLNVNINYVIMRHNVGELEQLKAWADTQGIGFQPEYSIFPKRDGDKKPLSHRVTNRQLVRLFNKDVIHKPKPMLCKPASIKMRIDPDGTLHPCEMLEYRLGSLKENSLAEIWSSQIAKEFRSIDIQNPAKCNVCKLKDSCLRCPGVAQMEDGDMSMPSSWACRVSHLYDAL